MASQACIDVYLVDDVLCGDANTMLNAQQYAAEEAICCRQTRSLPCLFGKTNVMNATWLTGNPANQVLHLRKCSLNGHTFWESTREHTKGTRHFNKWFYDNIRAPRKLSINFRCLVFAHGRLSDRRVWFDSCKTWFVQNPEILA
eukprot:7641967-Pyramimonas_sp.AAC.1